MNLGFGWLACGSNREEEIKKVATGRKLEPAFDD